MLVVFLDILQGRAFTQPRKRYIHERETIKKDELLESTYFTDLDPE